MSKRRILRIVVQVILCISGCFGPSMITWLSLSTPPPPTTLKKSIVMLLKDAQFEYEVVIFTLFFNCFMGLVLTKKEMEVGVACRLVHFWARWIQMLGTLFSIRSICELFRSSWDGDEKDIDLKSVKNSIMLLYLLRYWLSERLKNFRLTFQGTAEYTF